MSLNLPGGDDWLARRLQDFDRRLAEGFASIATSFQSTAQALTQQQQQLAQQQQQLAQQQQQLAQTVSALPVSVAGNVYRANWQATNNAIITRVTFPWPSGKTKCDVSASAMGFFVSDFNVPNSDRASFRLRINGADSSDALPMVPDNQDTFWFTGAWARRVEPASPSVVVEFVSYTGGWLAPGDGLNRVALSATAIFS